MTGFKTQISDDRKRFDPGPRELGLRRNLNSQISNRMTIPVKKRSHRDARWLNSTYKGNSTKVLLQEGEPGGEPEPEPGPDGELAGRGEGEQDALPVPVPGPLASRRGGLWCAEPL